jgi:hypothetical protein
MKHLATLVLAIIRQEVLNFHLCIAVYNVKGRFAFLGLVKHRSADVAFRFQRLACTCSVVA